MPVIGKNVISWFYAYVEHIEIKTKTVNIIHFPYLDLSQNVKIRDVPVGKQTHDLTVTASDSKTTQDRGR